MPEFSVGPRRLRPAAAPRRVSVAAVALLAIVACAAPAEAQRGGFRGANAMSELRSDDVKAELKLTDEQKAKLAEIEKQAGADNFDAFRDRIRDAEGEEARQAVFAEMRAAGEKARADAEAAAMAVLTPEQRTKLAARVVASGGAGALSDGLVREELRLSADQAAKLKTLGEQQAEAARKVDYRSQGSRDAFRAEWDAKTLAVLNDDQRKTFQSLSTPMDASVTTVPVKSPATTTGAVTTAGAPAAPVRPVVPTPPTVAAPTGEAKAASFGDGDAPAVVQADGQETKSLSFNFRYAPWSDVLALFADRAGLTLDLNETPPGTFNYRDARSYTPTEALDVLNGYLLQKGYILVRRDSFLVCLNLDRGVPPNLVPNVLPEDLPNRGANELLSVVYPIKGGVAAEVAKEVELLLGPQGRVAALGTSNSLVVTDIGSNLRRIGRLLDAAAAAGPGDLVFKSYGLKHIDSDEAVTLVRGQLGLGPAGVQNVSSGAFEDYRRDRERRDRGDQGRAPQTPPAPTANVAADPRTGNLLVTATATQQRIVEQVLLAVDVPGSVAAAGGRQSKEPYLKVYTLAGSDPGEVTKTLDVLMPGVVVNEDGRNRKIHVFAPAAVHDEVEGLIRQLDGVGGANGQAVTVIPLSTLDPYGTAGTLRMLFTGDGDSAPVIEADTFGRRLMVRGTPDQVSQVKALLAQLGEDGSGARAASAGGTFRTIPLGGRDPDELLPLLERIWEASEGGPLRKMGSGPGKLIERRSVGEAQRPTAAFSLDDEIPAGFSAREGSAREASGTETAAPEASTDGNSARGDSGEESSGAGTPAREATGTGISPREGSAPTASGREGSANKPAADESSGVTMTVRNGNLMLASDDEEALDRLEDLVQRLGQVVPPRTKWTVFYLQSADVTEVATMLEQIFPSSSVSSSLGGSGDLIGSLTSGMSSFGGNLMSVAGLDGLGADDQTLRIIPDVRSNSLFISGPADKIAEVEQTLEVLDASDLPNTLRDRVPRMIPVQHAEVQEVATIVREVFKDALNPAAALGGGNPLAALLGGGGGGRRGGGGGGGGIELPPTKMTLGVDDRTSKLIVAADDALFRQVEELVASLDKSALDARRTVRVITLQNADTALVGQTLGSLLPRVRVSTTGERRPQPQPAATPTATGSSNTAQSAPQPNQEDQERVRRFFEERARQGGQRGGGEAGSGSGGVPDAGTRGSGGGRSSRGGFGGGGGSGRSGRGR